MFMKDSREHILKTAYLLFLRKSYKAVTMKDIVEETGLSKGAFYHYFNSKEEVFEEVVNKYFMKLIDIDYDRFPHDSLCSFYNGFFKFLDDYIKQIESSGASMEQSVNFYFLIFEALRIIPEFRKRIDELHRKELNAWKNVIRTAREKGEIKTSLNDEAVAKLFIYGNDGAGIRLILHNDLEEMKSELSSVYNGLYSLLKT